MTKKKKSEPAAKPKAKVSGEELIEALESGTAEVRQKPQALEDTFTQENVEKFILGDITWAQLMGMTMEEAYNVAEYGYRFYTESRFHDARVIFEALVLSNPYDAYFHNMLGAVYQQIDLKDEAFEQYTIAIDLDEEAMHAYVNRGEMLLEQGKLVQAVEDFEKAVKLDKEGKDPKVVRARAYAEALSGVVTALKKAAKKQ